MSCLDNVVGITDTDCPCFVEGLSPEKIDALKLSTSGLYVDGLPGVPPMKDLKGAKTCGDFADMALKRLADAVKKTRSDIILGIDTLSQRRAEKYIGTLGHMLFSRPYIPTKPVAGMRITPVNKHSDAQISLTQISLITFTAVTTTVYLYKTPPGGMTGTEVGHWDVTTSPQAYTPVTGFPTDGLLLPLYENGQPIVYYFEYNTNGVQPMDIKPSCNCQGTESLLKQFVTVSGFSADTANSFPGTGEAYTGGLVANVTISCPPDNFICRQYNDLDPVAVLVAESIRHYAGYLIIDDLLNRQDIDRFTMVEREKLYGKRAALLKEYKTMMQYLPTVINTEASDCYICKETADGQPMATLIPL